MSSQPTSGYITVPHELTGSLAATPQELEGTIISPVGLEGLITHMVTVMKLDENFSLESENGVMNKTITQALLDLQTRIISLEDTLT